jgi:hypothetical protein
MVDEFQSFSGTVRAHPECGRAEEIATADGSQELLASITATSDEVSIA